MPLNEDTAPLFDPRLRHITDALLDTKAQLEDVCNAAEKVLARARAMRATFCPLIDCTVARLRRLDSPGDWPELRVERDQERRNDG